MARPKLSAGDYVRGVRAGDRLVLARAITLVESRQAEDVAVARDVLQTLYPDTGRAWRIGVSGVPGVGKSTFLEALGTRLVEQGRRVAVLAIDPSSSISGGSILGDKTRMARLSRSPQAFVRPTAGGGAVGGIAHRTREALLLCEAAGFDTVFVETIGVGQSETAVAAMVDEFVVLMLAGAGDELQGIKRGILEMADAVVVTKADGDGVERATRAARELEGALAILRGSAGAPEVHTCSARTGDGLDAIWTDVARRRDAAEQSGTLAARRREQDLHWFGTALDELLRERFFGDPKVAGAIAEMREAIASGRLAPTAAARTLIEGLLPPRTGPSNPE